MKKGDKILLCIFILLIGISSLISVAYKYWMDQGERVAIITQSEKVILSVDLNAISEPKKWTITNAQSEKNFIQAEQGKIRFVDADCPDLVCVKAGWLSKPGDMAVCLPHKLSIRIEGKKTAVNDVDQVTY